MKAKSSAIRDAQLALSHLLLSLDNKLGYLLCALELSDVLLHLLEVVVRGVDAEAGLEGLDARREVVHGLLGCGETEVALYKLVVGLDAVLGGISRVGPVAELRNVRARSSRELVQVSSKASPEKATHTQLNTLLAFWLTLLIRETLTFS